MRSFRQKLTLFLVAVAGLCFGGLAAEARIVDRTEVRERDYGYDVVIYFSIPMRIQSFTPKEKGEEVRLELRTVAAFVDPDDLADLQDQVILTWDRSSGVPLREMSYDGSVGDQPYLIVQFKKELAYDIRSSRDFTSVVIALRTETKKDVGESRSPYDVSDVAPAFQALFDRALRAIEGGDYRQAIQIYTKIANEADGRTRQKAIELLGLSYEKNGQLAQAKAEYERYLAAYPDGPEADRVRQRLRGILTAHVARPSERQPGRKQKSSNWMWNAYGAISQFYFRDQTTPENGDVQVNRSSVVSGLDFNGGGQSDDFSLSLRSVVSYDKDLLNDATASKDQGYVSKLSVEAEARKAGLRAEVGRQSINADGVFGRLDGVRAEWQALPMVRLSASTGYPVQSSKQDYIDQDRELYGVSVNFGPFPSGWDLSGYFLEQKNGSFTDRRAVGGEVRFTDADRNLFDLLKLDTSIYSTLDYDVYYNEVNVFMFLANWGLSTKTRVNLHFDYRNTPFLTTNNAIIGQGVTTLIELEPLYTDLEIEGLAIDRTAPTTAFTFGLTQDFSERWQVNGEFSTFKTDAMEASGGVAEVPATGPDQYYSLQFIGNTIFKEGDVAILGLRMANTERYDDYVININTRFPVTRKFRVNPKLYTSWRLTKLDTGADRFLIRPLLRMDYRLVKKVRLEFEGGLEYTREKSSLLDQSSTGAFVYAGYQMEF